MKKTLFTLLIVISLAVFTRSYQFAERFLFTHDNDLASWIVKDMVFDGHPRLVGQLTSAPGIFIGPLFYYSIVPFYMATGWDPIGSVWSSVIIGSIAVFSVYYVFYKMFGRAPAAVGSFLYAVSYGIVVNEREVVPTTPVMLWTVWFLYSFHLLIQGKRTGLLLTAILFSLVWHLNLALALLFPLSFITILLNWKKFKIREILLSGLLLGILSIPLGIFEARHDFNQARALIGTFASIGQKAESRSLGDKVMHVVQYAVRNATVMFYWDHPQTFSRFIIPGVLLSVVFLAGIMKKIPRYIIPLVAGWIVLYVAFFTAHPINLSEYYLNGLNIVWILAASLLVSAFLNHRNLVIKSMGLIMLLGIGYYNLQVLLNAPVNKSGYLQKKALVEYITRDAREHGYPCVAVSYIVNPGYNLGYRYLFWQEKLHVNQPISGSPVYSIVFPHSLVNKLDKSFGALGLIMPDYNRYTEAEVHRSCSGADSNVTDPMFGFTK